MPNKCFVPGCKTGYASGSEENNISLFRAPKIEDAICKKLTVEHLHTNLLLSVMNHLMMEANINFIGCAEHDREITRSIIIFYIQCRMHFACNEANATRQKNKKQKNLSKQSKL